MADFDPESSARASGRGLKISPKAAREVCTTIKGMKLDVAKDFLEQVKLKKKAVPFRRHNKKVPHRRGLEKIATGRYPFKAAKKILEVLESAESNAIYKGFELDNLRIIHAAAYPGMKIKRYIERAMGRSSPRFDTLVHVEIVIKRMGGS
jgi:large subunit ribosomal protein L22